MNNKIYWSLGIVIIFLSLIFLVRKEVVLVEHEQGQFFITNDFTLGWIHSVEKEPWYEVYSVKDHQLILTETYFKTFGAGTPADGQFIETNDGYIHFLINQGAEEINMMVSNNVKVAIHTKNNEIKLYKLVKDYTNVTISVKDVYLWQYYRGEKYD